ncbi:DNA-methyltransferase [Helicobacter himalayensis]|uniref:DNA-methyltransferase n=1 Tax=Helicobacter himalayensis TaxID=1591088 RepID=UPI0008359681|nr:site-specific DNA-methyltransferase [Helicobacter himalayensis]
MQNQLPINQILQGNSLELLQTIPDCSIDLIFADPPYYMRVEGSLRRPEGSKFSGCDDVWDNAFLDNADYVNFTRSWLKECKRILKPNGSIWVIGSMQCVYSIGGAMQELGFWFINDVIWHKSNPTPNFHGTRLNNSHETLIWATKDKKSKYAFNYKTAKELNCEIIGFENGVRKQLGSVWRIPVCSGNERLKDTNGNKLHNTQKPESLLYRIVAISSKMGDIVLDPFGGTMTTAVAAKILGRNYIMLEQNATYIQYGKRRLELLAFEDSPIAKAEFDKKPLKVSLTEMIVAGFLQVGESVYLNNTSFEAKLTSAGRLEFEEEIYDIHTLSARLKNTKAERLNGFRYWKVRRGDSYIFLDKIREEYRKSLD